ncbi:hypothetical protein SAMN04515671_2879 [Nakamurella panacisegetis]|uniref:Uncharacterized protein n=1 Tax=Nakamurella panacisegetis TaxID=1090615 RepID=A0A1H0PR59_9ACTN|nr:hypothetical protein [Nakamurella panacisegetis]SDP07474.1 hypothetical protein SAMN04515671_2879 [Nakamurella panacisegetis]
MDQHPPGNPTPSVVPPGPVDQVHALDAVDDELARLAGMTTAEQVEVFSRIHQQLTSALAATGSQTGGGPSGPATQPPSGQQRPGQQQPGQHRPGQPSGTVPGGHRPGQPSGPRGR